MNTLEMDIDDWRYIAFTSFFRFLGNSAYYPEFKGMDVFEALKGEGVIVAANHHSVFDAFLIGTYLDRRIHWLGRKSSLWGRRAWGWLNSFFGTIPVEKGNSAEAIKASLHVLKLKRALGIFPEGAMRPKRKVWQGKTGVARIALWSGVKVIPAGIIGTEGRLPWGAWFPEPGKKVEVHYGEPLDFSEYGKFEPLQLIDKQILREITNRVMRHVRRLSKGYGVPPEVALQLKRENAWF